MAKYRSKIIVDAWEFDGRLDYSKTLPKIVKDATSKIRLTQTNQLKIINDFETSEIDIGDMVLLHENGIFSGMNKKQFDSIYEFISD